MTLNNLRFPLCLVATVMLQLRLNAVTGSLSLLNANGEGVVANVNPDIKYYLYQVNDVGNISPFDEVHDKCPVGQQLANVSNNFAVSQNDDFWKKLTDGYTNNQNFMIWTDKSYSTSQCNSCIDMYKRHHYDGYYHNYIFARDWDTAATGTAMKYLYKYYYDQRPDYQYGPYNYNGCWCDAVHDDGWLRHTNLILCEKQPFDTKQECKQWCTDLFTVPSSNNPNSNSESQVIIPGHSDPNTPVRGFEHKSDCMQECNVRFKNEPNGNGNGNGNNGDGNGNGNGKGKGNGKGN